MARPGGYRPALTPLRSTNVDPFTGTTSFNSSTAVPDSSGGNRVAGMRFPHPANIVAAFRLR